MTRPSTLDNISSYMEKGVESVDDVICLGERLKV